MYKKIIPISESKNMRPELCGIILVIDVNH